VNGQGALAGLIIGISFGLVHYIANILLKSHCGTPGLFIKIACLHFNENAAVITYITAVTTYTVSLFYEAPRAHQLDGCWGEEVYEEVGDEIECDDLSTSTRIVRRRVDGKVGEGWKDWGLGVGAGGVLIASVVIMIAYR
jgi:hypothetical protein